MIAALHAPQALAGAGELALLASMLPRGAIGQAATTGGALVLCGDVGERCVAKASSGVNGVLVEACDQHAAGAVLPAPMLHDVPRTRATALPDDALASARYRDDPYVQQARPRSVLCVLLLTQSVANGVLYLEHSAAACVFTAERVLMLELLATQGVSALESVRLAGLLAQEKAARRDLEQAAREQSEAAARDLLYPAAKG